MAKRLWDVEDLQTTEDSFDQLDDVCVVQKFVLGGGKVYVPLHDLVLDIAIRKASKKVEVRDVFSGLFDRYIDEERKLRKGTVVEKCTEMSPEVVVRRLNMQKRRATEPASQAQASTHLLQQKLWRHWREPVAHKHLTEAGRLPVCLSTT
ncbi:hypothetical protein BWQ96_09562 [Gracilariopsis chorda]|uniref:Uncharacterized protein n=1 Tax=Gracilariopsis chorda TaxID=448386 RepID=A0A2V3IF63_9FLOR|nr:hypothetical protein BWQ96_09562 [Gracilariopsis chorda]|eukprot:PXF40729.1 hypothetical protein BWQ96_09562 [Gracilariopsis chorda]